MFIKQSIITTGEILERNVSFWAIAHTKVLDNRLAWLVQNYKFDGLGFIQIKNRHIKIKHRHRD